MKEQPLQNYILFSKGLVILVLLPSRVCPQFIVLTIFLFFFLNLLRTIPRANPGFHTSTSWLPNTLQCDATKLQVNGVTKQQKPASLEDFLQQQQHKLVAHLIREHNNTMKQLTFHTTKKCLHENYDAYKKYNNELERFNFQNNSFYNNLLISTENNTNCSLDKCLINGNGYFYHDILKIK